MDQDQMKEQFAQWLGEAVNLGSRFKEDLDLDSLSVIELTLNIEDKYKVMFSPQELLACLTIGGVISKIIERNGA